MAIASEAPPRSRALDRSAVHQIDWAFPVMLFTAALGLYAVSAATWPTEWDSVSLVFGTDRFDVRDASPHAPGYWLYLAFGRMVRALTPWSSSNSLLVVSALAAAATVAMGYVVGRALGGRWLGGATALVLLTSPFLAFYGSSISTYPFDALACLVLLHLAWRAGAGSWHGAGAALVLGLAGGTRQSSLLLLAPLALIAIGRSTRNAAAPLRVAARTLAAAGVGLAVWVVPLALEQPGGLATVQEEGALIWRGAVGVTSPFYGAPADGIRYNLGQTAGYTLAAVMFVLPATAAGLLLGLVGRRTSQSAMTGSSQPLFSPGLVLTAAAAPPFLFVALFHFGKGGYVLSYLPALVLLMLWPAVALRPRPRLVVSVILVLGCAAQAVRFLGAPGILPGSLTDRGVPWFTQSRFGAPYRLTVPTIRDTDREVERYLAIGRSFDPVTDELVYVYMNGGHRFRHAMLTLPEFRAHYLQLGFHEWSARHRRWHHERDHVLELDAGAQAVLIVDEPGAEVTDLVTRGIARAVELDTGAVVYVVPAGQTIYGVKLATKPVHSGPS